MTTTGDDTTLAGGSYEVIRQRLLTQALALRERANALNEERRELFGGTELAILGNERVRTENNCVPRDIVQVQGHLLFGYNVALHLKKETRVSDVLTLQDFVAEGDAYRFEPVATEGSFLDDAAFRRELTELFQYYKNPQLLSLTHAEGRLLAVFQTGQKHSDIKVFRWTVDAEGNVAYVDNRGERDFVFPRQHDFQWVATSRSDHILGRHPHVNVLDELFVETVGGDLTVKIEDNTRTGEGIYAEPVDDPNQSLDDADIAYAEVGSLILLRIQPFDEPQVRYLVYNRQNRQVVRVDAIGQACVSLPEDHGIVFPGGYYLQTGDYKVFDDDDDGLEFQRSVRSPNGEDVLYVFNRRSDGHYVLYSYNLIDKSVANPIHTHGYSLFEDGRMVVFKAAEEPTRVHPVRIWRTPYVSMEHAAAAPEADGALGRLGNAELVRGLSDALTVARIARAESPTRQRFEELIRSCARMRDAYGWLGQEAVALLAPLDQVQRTAELIVDEFEKVQALRRTAVQALRDARVTQEALLDRLRPEDLHDIHAYLKAMTGLRRQRGQLITLQDTRYIDLTALGELEAEVVEATARVGASAVEFLLGDQAFAPLMGQLGELQAAVPTLERGLDAAPLREQLQVVSEGLTLLSEVVQGLEIEDPVARTTILEGISEVFSLQNRVRAELDLRYKELATHEGRAEFAAQLKLFGQAVQAALGRATTPDACDDELSRLLLSLEELEARFGELDELLPQLYERREEVQSALGARKQGLVDERNRRAQNLQAAAERILGGVARRARTFSDEDDLNAWFAGDAMVMKLRQLAEQLAELGDAVKAEELRGRLKTTRQDALRGLRDRADLFEDGENLIKLGPHRFAVNKQPLELALVPRDDRMWVTLMGTDFAEPVEDPDFDATRACWTRTVVSESPEVYRGEFLAWQVLQSTPMDTLKAAALTTEGLLDAVRAFASDRYEEGYERGLHDVDAAAILSELLKLWLGAGALRHAPAARAQALLWWSQQAGDERDRWTRQARSLAALAGLGGADRDLAARLDALCGSGGAWLADGLGHEPPRLTVSRDAVALRDDLGAWLDTHGGRGPLTGLADLALDDRLPVLAAWVDAWLAQHPQHAYGRHEAVALLAVGDAVAVEASSAPVRATVAGLLGQHPRIRDRHLELQVDAFAARLSSFERDQVPAFRAYQAARHTLLEAEKARLRIDELKPRVMSAFVRNRLIDEVYLPLIGANLTKQMGGAGANKRTDQMGLLLLISPPGYGKTTLMEYVADRLGLAFLKINGPALGHEVHSLDPAEAPNATARQEVEKLNLALEMGNNVMLYVDDIQHCHPEFLQKFISLCDAQRRIEGVWKGRTRTYDMRGKAFCVVMAGNPYTESGDRFQIPDMLANRADVYNLGEVLEGRGEQFALSYLENALTSNPALQPLAARGLADLYRLVRLAEGDEVPTSEFDHDWSAVQLSEMTEVVRRMLQLRDVLLKVNAEYIRSAAQEASFRTEPRFQLQGSYRNMAKLTEKVVPAMNDAELQALVSDHYLGEAQTLTTGAESNLLKLGELRGVHTAEQAERWDAVKREFVRLRRMGGSEDDPVTRVTGTLSGLDARLESMVDLIARGLDRPPPSVTVEAPQVAVAAPSVEVTPNIAVSAPTVEVAAPQVTVHTQLPPPAMDWLTHGPTVDPDAVVELRQKMVAAVHGALEGNAAEATELTALVPLLHGLGVEIDRLAEAHLNDDDRARFLDAFRRKLATILGEAAG